MLALIESARMVQRHWRGHCARSRTHQLLELDGSAPTSSASPLSASKPPPPVSSSNSTHTGRSNEGDGVIVHVSVEDQAKDNNTCTIF